MPPPPDASPRRDLAGRAGARGLARTAIAAALVLIAATGSLVLARLDSTEHAVSEAPPPSSAEPPAPDPTGSAPQEEQYLGVILARESVDISPRQEGQIRAVHVRLGDHVPEGGVIASLDARTTRFDLTMAEATVTAAKIEHDKAAVELTQATENLNRRTSLHAEALASAEDLAAARYQRDLAELRVQATSAQLSERRARADQLRQVASDTEIRAPFAGIVAARYVDPGANVTPTSRIVRLLSAEAPFVRFAVPVTRAASLSKGLRVQIRITSHGEVLSGAIEKVAPEIDSASRMVFTEATLDPAEASRAAILSGEVAHVSIVRETP